MAMPGDFSAFESVRHSLVVTFHNEQDNIPALLELARHVLGSLPGGCEYVLVDDGSDDATPAQLAAFATTTPSARILRMHENAGQAAALWRGLQAARGAVILTMDGDGQNDPRDFPRLLEALRARDAALVCGWRQRRGDGRVRQFTSRFGNAVRRWVLRDEFLDTGSQLRVLRREALAALRPGPMLQSLLPSQIARAGFRVVEIPVRHHPRLHGRSHYGVRALAWMPLCALLAEWQARRSSS